MRYTAFNLTWESRDLPLPELASFSVSTADSASPDIRIAPQSSEIWPDLPPGPHDTPLVQIAPGDIRLTIDGVARFRIHNGSHIAWERWSETVSDCDLRAFLLGWAFSALLCQRGLLLFHANALARNGQAIAFMGASGAGKSTLAYALMSQGWELLADDLAAITPEGSVLPGISQIKLCSDAIEAFNLDKATLKPSTSEPIKYAVLGDKLKTATCAVPLRIIYLLKSRHSAATPSLQKPEVKWLNEQKIINKLLHQQLFGGTFILGLRQQGSTFLAITNLLKRTSVAELHLYHSISTLHGQLNEINLYNELEITNSQEYKKSKPDTYSIDKNKS